MRFFTSQVITNILVVSYQHLVTKILHISGILEKIPEGFINSL